MEKSKIWLGNACVWTINDLDANSSRDITLNVGDYVGDTVLTLTDSKGQKISEPIKFFIEPRGLTSVEFNKIRHGRIPYLLKKFGAENVHDIIYEGGYATYKIQVQDYALDELLHHYSKELLELTIKIMESLTYQSKKEIRKYKSEIKGKIKWQKTMRLRFQKGLSHATAHVCERRRRNYLTPTNLTTLNMLTELRAVLRVHKDLLSQSKFREALPMLRVVGRDNPQLIREAEAESVRSKNRSYKPLITLYKDFVFNFKPMFVKSVPIDTQKMRDFYRVWAMCEIADSLDLTSIGHTMREFKNHHETIFLYFQNMESIRHPWSEISDETALYMGGGNQSLDLSFIGPELYLVYEGTDVFIDTIYGNFRGGLPRQKIYEALGYMNDFGFKVGIVLYPGLRFHIKVDDKDTDDPKILIEAPFIPETSETENQVKKRKDYLKYLIWSAVILHKAAKRKDEMSRIVKSITRTIEVKYAIEET
jgi:hypothetical protein